LRLLRVSLEPSSHSPPFSTGINGVEPLGVSSDLCNLDNFSNIFQYLSPSCDIPIRSFRNIYSSISSQLHCFNSWIWDAHYSLILESLIIINHPILSYGLLHSEEF
jgi:hypothetical protein